MQRDTYIERISRLRADLKRLIAESEAPQIEAMLRNADMELHWALWNLGVAVPLRPEFEYADGQQE